MDSKTKKVVSPMRISEAAAILGRRGGSRNTPAQQAALKENAKRKKGFHFDICKTEPRKPDRWSTLNCKKEITAIQDAPSPEVYLIPDEVADGPEAFMEKSFSGRSNGKTVRLKVVSVEDKVIKVRRVWSYEL